jgi:hypothetical protein
MKRQLILAMAILVVAGCSAPRAPTDAAADASPPNTATDAPTTTTPAPAAAAARDTTPATDRSKVPARFVGEWAIDAAACTSPGHESQLGIATDRIAFHESSGTIQSVAGDDSNLTVVARLTGEGETREATYRFRLSADGRTLTDIGSGTGMARQRCD